MLSLPRPEAHAHSRLATRPMGLSATNRQVRICKLTPPGRKRLEREVLSRDCLLEGIIAVSSSIFRVNGRF